MKKIIKNTFGNKRVWLILSVTALLILEIYALWSKQQAHSPATYDAEQHSVPMSQRHQRYELLRFPMIFFIFVLILLNKGDRKNKESPTKNQKKNDNVEFLAKISHEIRTPLNAITGTAEMLAGASLTGEQRKHVSTIINASVNLIEKIDNVLAFSNIEAGNLKLDNRYFSLQGLISDCLELFSATAEKKDIDFFSSISPDLSDNFIGDPSCIHKILVNLIGNAFKFTRAGYVFLNVSSDNDNRNRKTVDIRFSVSDSGIGIDKSDIETIFDPFEQLDRGTTRTYGGVGLGLALCKQLTEKMHGRIDVESTIGEGTTFTFTLPLKLNTNDSQEPLSSSLTLSKKNMLYLHRHAFLDEALREHAKANNIHLHIFRHPDKLIDSARTMRIPIDFILFSDDIDDVSGTSSPDPFINFTNTLRNVEACKQCSMLMLSNASSRYSLHQLNAVNALLKKPIGLNEIVNVLRSETRGIRLNQLVPVPESPFDRSKLPLRVLVAEDNQVNQIVIEGLLNKLDIHPFFAQNGKEAVDKCTQANIPFDLVFMDCEMPDMDGFEATEKIRLWEKNHNKTQVPIVALTAHVEPEHRQRVFGVGMNYYLSKPITLDCLKDALSTLGLRNPS